MNRRVGAARLHRVEAQVAVGAGRAYRFGAGLEGIGDLGPRHAPGQRSVRLVQRIAAAVQPPRPVDRGRAGRADQRLEHRRRHRVVEARHVARAQRVAAVLGGDAQACARCAHRCGNGVDADLSRQQRQQVLDRARARPGESLGGERLRNARAQFRVLAEEPDRVPQGAKATGAGRQQVEAGALGQRQVARRGRDEGVAADVAGGIAAAVELQVDQLDA